MTGNGFSERATKAVWDVLVPSPATASTSPTPPATGWVAYWTAYLKANYPAEYMAALLTSVGDDKDRMAIYLAECRKLGIKVLPPDVNESQARLRARRHRHPLRPGRHPQRRRGPWSTHRLDPSEQGQLCLIRRLPGQSERSRSATSGSWESLIRAGAFDSLGHTRKSLFLVQEQAVDAVIGVKRQEAIGQFDLFASAEPAEGSSTRQDRAGFPAHRRGVAAQAGTGPGTGDAGPVRVGPPAGRRRADPASATATPPLPSCWPRAATRATARWPASSCRSTGGSTEERQPWAIVTVEDLDASVEVLFLPQGLRPVRRRADRGRGRVGARPDQRPATARCPFSPRT